MDPGPEAAIEQVAEIAQDAVEAANQRAENAEAVSKAIAEAALEDHRSQQLESVARDFGAENDALRRELTAAHERIAQCEAKTAETSEALAGILSLSLIRQALQPPSPPDGAAGGPRESLEAQEVTEAEAEPATEPEPLPAPRKRRHLI